MFYDKFSRGNYLYNDNQVKNYEITCESTLFPIETGRNEDEIRNAKYVRVDFYLETIQKIFTNDIIALEAPEDEDPFSGGDDSGMDENTDTGFDEDPFTSDSSGEADFDSDPFGSAVADGDPFGDGDSNEGDGNKSKKKVIDRDEVKTSEYNISTQVRSIFPERLLNLRNIIDNNIENVELSISDNPKVDAILRGVITEYKLIKDIIDKYAEVITDKTYEDIFEMYVNIHSSLKKLRNIVINVNRKVE